jgi:hypothetical protein
MVNVLESTYGVDNGHMVRLKSLRHRVQYTMFVFGFGLCIEECVGGGGVEGREGAENEKTRSRQIGKIYVEI